MVSNKLLRGIGKQIAKVRIRAGKSAFTLNREMSFPEPKSARDNHISKLEKGELNITLETLEDIAAKCGCRVEVTIIRDRGSFPKVLHEDMSRKFFLVAPKLPVL